MCGGGSRASWSYGLILSICSPDCFEDIFRAFLANQSGTSWTFATVGLGSCGVGTLVASGPPTPSHLQGLRPKSTLYSGASPTVPSKCYTFLKEG